MLSSSCLCPQLLTYGTLLMQEEKKELQRKYDELMAQMLEQSKERSEIAGT